jgi:hypothetical protein
MLKHTGVAFDLHVTKDGLVRFKFRSQQILSQFTQYPFTSRDARIRVHRISFNEAVSQVPPSWHDWQMNKFTIAGLGIDYIPLPRSMPLVDLCGLPKCNEILPIYWFHTQASLHAAQTYELGWPRNSAMWIDNCLYRTRKRILLDLANNNDASGVYEEWRLHPLFADLCLDGSCNTKVAGMKRKVSGQIPTCWFHASALTVVEKYLGHNCTTIVAWYCNGL